jgi:tRNA pseudouridine38-40 synthase
MQRYFLQLSYKGTAYHGWQVQENTPHTVQQVLNEKLSMVLNEPIQVTGCGRTDTGVHAKDYYAHFDTTKTDLISNHDKWIYKLNSVLPNDVAVYQIN